MGSIAARKRKDGTTGYTAQIVLKKDGAVVHREARTFDRRQAAATWLDKRETELKAPGGLERAKRKGETLADAIDRYTKESLKEIGRTKAQVLRSIKNYSIANMAAVDIGSSDIVTLAGELGEGRTASTVGNYISHLSAVFAVAEPAWKIPLSRQAMTDAQVVLRRLGQVAKSRERSRRPTLDELDKLLTHFADRRARRAMLPMDKVVGFAIFSTRREGEIVRLRFDDFDRDGARILVRDMKHPGEKAGNDQWCELPPEAIAIVDSMPASEDGRIFPYSTDAVTANFTRACRLLGIDDLVFHDLRHDGVSRLFEMGKTIPQAASFSGHRSWQSLKRYTHLRTVGDKYVDWKWLPALTAA
ncbi:MAG: site-specific integrase [Hyphomicrobiales bacterium]|nr:MAG: site-specific integrase [Hyphomicrobiales bacterium]